MFARYDRERGGGYRGIKSQPPTHLQFCDIELDEINRACSIHSRPGRTRASEFRYRNNRLPHDVSVVMENKHTRLVEDVGEEAYRHVGILNDEMQLSELPVIEERICIEHMVLAGRRRKMILK